MPSITPRIYADIVIEDSAGTSQTYTVHEGDIIHDLVYTSNGVETTLTGAVRVINCAATRVTITQTCPPESYFDRIVQISSMVIDSSDIYDAELTQVNISDIVSIGSVEAPASDDPDADAITIGVGPQYQTLDAIIANETVSKVRLIDGIYETPLTISKDLVIIGPNEGAQKPVTNVALMSETGETTVASDSTGAIINGAIAINNADATVEFRGVNFTGNSLFTITAAKAVSFITCRFEGIIPNAAKTMMITAASEAACSIVIDGCYFGAPGESSGNAMYHIIEPNCTLQNGSCFSNNYFDLNCTTHNKLNFYKAVDGIHIVVENNYDAKSASMARIGFKGAIAATVDFLNNTYDDTDVEQWAGLVGMQPYNKDTTDMSGWTINFNGNVNNTQFEQITYMYFGANDMPYDEAKLPKVFVNGEAYDLPIINEQITA